MPIISCCSSGKQTILSNGDISDVPLNQYSRPGSIFGGRSDGKSLPKPFIAANIKRNTFTMPINRVLPILLSQPEATNVIYHNNCGQWARSFVLLAGIYLETLNDKKGAKNGFKCFPFLSNKSDDSLGVPFPFPDPFVMHCSMYCSYFCRI